MSLPASILFVGAHCDDIELFAGATLSRALREGVRVGVLVFSDHRGVVDAARAERAREEFRENLSWLSRETSRPIDDHTTDWLTACHGAFETERGKIYAALDALRDRYACVITHPSTDTNQDHQQVSLEARRVFKAHATLLGGEFPSNDLGEFSAQYFVPVGEIDVATKVQMVQRYESQQFGDRPYFSEKAVAGLLYARGAQVRAPAAEAFEVLGRVISRP